MAGTAADKKRLIRVTAANLRNNHLYISGLSDFLPRDCVGPARRTAKSNGEGQIELYLDGLNETIRTDIPADKSTGRRRNHLRERKRIGEFYRCHHIGDGDVVVLERLETRKYRLSTERQSADRSAAFSVGEFFSGIGLVRLALEKHGFQVVFANDIAPDKAEMYRHNWPKDDHLFVGDIHNIKADDLPPCGIFTASFPCNDLSIAGRWEGLSGKESSAFWGLVRILHDLGDHRPPVVMLENVVGFLMSHGGRDFEQALLALNELGYAVDAFILNAKHWAPQSRARLFVVAKQESVQEGRTFAMKGDARPDALFEFINCHPNIHWDIRELPSLPKPTKRLADIVEDLPDGHPDWWNKKRTDYFMGQLSEKHAEQAQRMIDGKLFTYATAFRRVRNGKSMAELRTDGIAGCLRTPRGGSGRQILFKAGHGKHQVRLLTARECARLQGVPDSYVIKVPNNQALFGFGDAVCVPAIEWIAENYLLTLQHEGENDGK